MQARAVWLLFCGLLMASCATTPVPTGETSPSPTASPVQPTAPSTDAPAIMLTGAQAIELVRVFVDAPAMTGDLTARGPTDGALTSYYEVEGQDVMASVDAHDGTITTLLMTPNIGDGHVTLDADRAVEVAEGFLVQRGVPLEGLERGVRLLNHGETSEYVIDWIGRVGDVIVPNSREVGVDVSTGRVFRYVNVDRPYDPPPEPVVDRVTAEAAAIRAANFSTRATIDKIELVISFTPSGEQRLVWRVQVSEGVSHAFVEVDAGTGAAVVVGAG